VAAVPSDLGLGHDEAGLAHVSSPSPPNGTTSIEDGNGPRRLPLGKEPLRNNLATS
jgi:hypothetical protein